MRSRLEAIDDRTWELVAGETFELPITCDPGFAMAVCLAYAGAIVARPYLLKSEAAEELVIAYELRSPGMPRMTLSPFGLPCAIGRQVGLRPLAQSYVEIERALSIRYRSIDCVFPFYESSVPSVSWRHSLSHNVTHILTLDDSWQNLLVKRLASETRWGIRRSEREQVRVALSSDREDVKRYYEMHVALAADQGGYDQLHPERLFFELMHSRRTEIALAYVGENLASGGIFFEDGPTTSYWHGATDRQYRFHQPVYALLAFMVRRALEKKHRAFNFGGSMGVQSLERFKDRWGAIPTPYVAVSASNLIVRVGKLVLCQVSKGFGCGSRKGEKHRNGPEEE